MWDVYMAFLPAFSKKCLRSSPPQATTKSTSLSKFVVCGMCCHVRKCVQRMRDLIAALFLILSCLSTFWSCCMIEPSRSAPSAAKAAWLAWEWRRLFSWAFIFSTAFFQLVNGLVTHTPPVRWSDFPDFLQTLQKAPLQSSSYSSQEKSFSHFVLNFLLLVVERCFARFFVKVGVLSLTVLVHCFLGGLTSNSKLSTSDSSSESLLLLSSLEADVDWVLASPKQERISITLKSKMMCLKTCVIPYILCHMWKWCIALSYYFWISCWLGLLAQKLFDH